MAKEIEVLYGSCPLPKRTALVLSGGGSRGAYQAGVWQALRELDVKIDIVTGTSVGALNAAMVAQGDFDLTKDLWKEMETTTVFDVPENSQPIDYLKEIALNQGAGTSGLKELLDEYLDEDAIRKSSMDLGITVFSLSELKGKHLFLEDIPKGKLDDYVMASASAFPMLHAYKINGKDYIDGGYSDVIPIEMALTKEPTHVIAVNLRGHGIINQDAIEKAPNLTWIETPWDLGFQFLFDVNNSRRLLRLGYLDTLKAFHILDGNYFAFSKGTFNKATIPMADMCGKIFGLDPNIIYTEEIYLRRLKEKLDRSENEFHEDVASSLRKTGKKLSDMSNPIEDLRNLSDLLREIREEEDGLKKFSFEKVLTYIIAENFKKKGEKSPFLHRAAVRLLPDQIKAARFLVKCDLI